jgi:hypothetical protein
VNVNGACVCIIYNRRLMHELSVVLRYCSQGGRWIRQNPCTVGFTHFHIFATMALRLRLGFGATVSIQIKYLHPSQYNSEKFSNPLPGQRLEMSTVVGQDGQRINGQRQDLLLVSHDDFKGKLYGIKSGLK